MMLRHDVGHRPPAWWQEESESRWPFRRLKHFVRLNPTKREIRGRPGDTEVSFLPMEAIGEYGGLDLAASRLLADVLAGYTYFRDGDVLVAKITPCFENGKGALATGLVNGIGFGTTELHVLRPDEELDAKYLFYLTISRHFRRVGTSTMYGAGGQKRVPEDFVEDFVHPLPGLRIQQAIADFLDRETAKIDALIDQKRRLIDLLQEKRAALITRAVTKGLDPDVEMKDSGVEWVGSIPAHWDVAQLRHLITSLNQGWSPSAHDRPAETDEWAVLKLSAVSQGRFNPDQHKALPRDLEGDPSIEVTAGDVLVTRANTPQLVGDACFVASTRPHLMFSDLIYRLRFGGLVIPEYATYWLISETCRQQIKLDARGSSLSMVKVSQAHIRSWMMPLPPIEEQQKIASLLREQEIIGLQTLNEVEAAITLLHEYRTALISAAVTGKIDVREAA